jgi:hypothetical protein
VGHAGMKVLGFLRGTEALYQLVYQPPLNGKPRAPIEVPLSAKDAPELCNAWAQLSNADLKDPSIAEALSLVLANTLPMRGLDWKRQLPGVTQAKEAPRATAAHPRAYRGTKHQPPKLAEPERLDLRLYLGSWHTEKQLLTRLGLPAVDPYFQKCFERDEINRDLFVEEFVYYFLPCLKEWNLAIRFFALRLQELKPFVKDWQGVLLKLLVMLVEGGSSGAIWMAMLSAYTERAEIALDALLETGAYHGFSSVGEENLTRFVSLTPEDVLSLRLRVLLRGGMSGASFEYLESGFALSERFNPTYTFEQIPPGKEAVDVSLIETILQHGAVGFEEDSKPSFWAMHLWVQCGRLEGFASCLEALALSSIRGQPCYQVTKLMCSFWSLEGDALERWSFLRSNIGKLIQPAENIAEEYQRKFLYEASQWFWWLEDHWLVYLPVWRDGLPLLALRARPPFSTKPAGAIIIVSFLVFLHDEQQVSRLFEVETSSWKALERATQTTNDAELIESGVRAICYTYLEFSIKSFKNAPGPLLESARWLGMITKAQRDEVLIPLKKHPLWSPTLSDWTLASLVSQLDEDKAADLVPKAAREHVQGNKPLKEGQLKRHLTRIFEGLDVLRCRLIQHGVETVLQRSFPELAGTPQSLHALAMLTYADRNRRGLRRLLKERFAGNMNAERQHIVSQRWLAKNPEINEHIWIEGAPLTKMLDHLGEVSIRTERDLLEVLKMGTYTRTCLGLGGGFMYSAAAVALDINKQVLFARDKKGTVIARQLIAITETKHLLMYHVYPLSSPAALKEFFLAHNQNLAKALGITLCIDAHPDNTSQCEEEVEPLLSHEFWDDGAWDGKSD